MENINYKIKYLPQFEQDLSEIVDYISNKLMNPMAATNLVNEVEKSILKRLESPLSYEAFPTTRKRKNAYYRIYVKNYMVFYVVIEEVMEVRRILYDRRNLSKQI